MIPVLDLRGRTPGVRELRATLPRAELDVEAAVATVRPICDDVAARGAEAVLDASERFDGVRPTSLRVPADVLAAALAELDPEVRAALEESIRRARIVHEEQRRTTTTTGRPCRRRRSPSTGTRCGPAPGRSARCGARPTRPAGASPCPCWT